MLLRLSGRAELGAVNPDDQVAMAAAFRFLRQLSRPNAPRLVAKSGRAAGSGTIETAAWIDLRVLMRADRLMPHILRRHHRRDAVSLARGWRVRALVSGPQVRVCPADVGLH